jgi:hypothetical protein
MPTHSLIVRLVLLGIALPACLSFAHPNHGEEGDDAPSAYLDFWSHNTGRVYF